MPGTRPRPRLLTQGVFLLLFCAVAAGCATGGATVAPAPALDEPAMDVVTLEREASGMWRATWHLQEPARELRFERQTSGFRGEIFESLTPGYFMGKRTSGKSDSGGSGSWEVLRTEGVPSRTIAVRFPEDTRVLEKDYLFFQKFTDGSVGIYSGHLLARRMSGDAGEECTNCLVNTFRLVPRDGESVVAGGLRSTTPLEWNDPSEQGCYVYFGSIEPLETPTLISITDPGLPVWLKDVSATMIPRLFELFAQRLDAELPSRPTVLTSYTRSDSTGYSFKGGVVPGVVQLAMEGTGWDEESEEGRLRILRMLAHEAVHLWNGQIIEYPDSEHAWMHEGSADALAERALLALGEIDEARFLQLQTDALNDCIRGLGADPLTKAGEKGAFSLYYSCGNSIGLLTEGSLQKGDTSADLFEVWKRLIARTIAKSDRAYGPDDYIAVLREMGGSAVDAALVMDLVGKPATPSILVDALQSRGITVEIGATPPESQGQALSKAALLHLFKANCRGSFSFRSTTAGFALDRLECDGLQAGEVLTAIGGHDVLRNGHLAADAVHEACRASGDIAVTVRPSATAVDQQERKLRCNLEFPARVPYVTIVDRGAGGRGPVAKAERPGGLSGKGGALDPEDRQSPDRWSRATRQHRSRLPR